jgi:hypothetical protein
MLIGGVTGLIPGLGKGLGAIGSKVAGKFGTSVANSAIGRMGSKIASSALGKGVQALGRGIKNVGGKLATLGSKAGKTLPGKIVAAPFKAAANLGTKLGNATRGALEKKFPNVFKPKAPTTKPSTGGATREEPSGSKAEVTDDADAVARDAAKKADEVQDPMPLQERIDRATGVNKGSEYQKAQDDLREFYANQQRESLASGTNVKRTYTDQMADAKGRPMTNPDGSPYGYVGEQNFDVYRHTYDNGNLTTVNMRVKLDAQPGVGPDDLARVRADAYKGIDEYYNSGKVLPGGDRLHVNVEFVDDASKATIRVNTHPGGGAADQGNWYVNSNPTTHAHELGHGLGFGDEYYTKAAYNRGGGNVSNVHTDDSLMGDFWKRNPDGSPIPDPKTGSYVHRPGTELKDRHLTQLQDDINKARAAKGGSTSSGPPTPGPRAAAPKDQPKSWSDLDDDTREIFKLADADPPVVNRLLGKGMTPDDVYTAVTKTPGAIPMMDDLAQQGVRGDVIRSITKNAGKAAEKFPDARVMESVEDLVRSGKLTNLDSLSRHLDDIAGGKKGAITELERALERARAGHDVQLGAVNGKGGDVVDLTDQEVLQMKDVTSASELGVAENMSHASNQLAGKGAKRNANAGQTETPPTRADGTPYTRTVDLTIRNADNPLQAYDDDALKQWVRENMGDVASKDAVDQVVIRINGRIVTVKAPW